MGPGGFVQGKLILLYVIVHVCVCVIFGGGRGKAGDWGGSFIAALEYASLFLILLHLFIYFGGGVQMNEI